MVFRATLPQEVGNRGAAEVSEPLSSVARAIAPHNVKTAVPWPPIRPRSPSLTKLASEPRGDRRETRGVPREKFARYANHPTPMPTVVSWQARPHTQ